ncbi:MAG: transposase, partial [bacterium]
SIIKNNHREYKKLTDQLVKSGYQPVLDYGWLVESNPSVLYPTVLDNFDWSLFNDLARKYQRCYSDFLAQQRTELTANDKCAQIDFLSFFSPLESESANSFNCPIELAEDELAEIVRLKSKKNGGRRFEHDFMPLFKTFVILRYMDIKPSVTNVIRTLCGNPYLLVKLQFKHNQLPSQRVIYRFDQVMSSYGLWNEASELGVFDNIKRGVIDPRKERFFGQDTTHVEACATKSKKNKQCAHCPNVADCKHPRLTDNTAGVLVKKRTEHHHAHKLALGNLLHSELCLAFKVFKGNTNDGKTFSPLLEMVKQKFPEFNFSHIFVDGIYDDEDCYEASKTYYPQAKLIPSRINPRNRNDKPIENRGILLVNKRGQAVCINRQKMVFVSRELKKQSYIWGCPVYHPDVTTDKKFTAKQKYQIIEQYKYSRDLSGTAKRHGITPKILRVWVSRMQCAKDKKLDPKGLRGLEDECPLKDQCCPDAKMGRIFRTKAFDYPFIDWELPQFSYQRRVLVALRLANERIISRLKENLSGDKLFKQNDFNVEAHVAKSLLAQHIFASVAFRLEHPEGIRRIKTFHAMFQ